MIRVEHETRPEVWDELILELGGHPLQLWGWGEVKARHGWKAERLALYDGETIVSAAQVLVRRLPFPLGAFAYVPRGLAMPMEKRGVLLQAVADDVKKQHGPVVLSIEPDAIDFEAPADWKLSRNRVLPALTIRLDLEQPEETLLAQMAKKTRQYIRKSAKDEVVVKRVTTSKGLDECMAIYRQTSDRAQFALHSRAYYDDVFEQLGEHSPIFAAYKEGKMVAFLWLAISAETAFELYGGMTSEGQALRANYTLKWHAIRKSKEWGLHWYDFGGLINDGVSNFKRSWTTGDTTFTGTYDKALSIWYPIWAYGLPIAKDIIHTLKKLRK